MVCDQVVKWALEHKILMADLNEGNVLVVMQGTNIVSMQLIDFGYPGLFSVSNAVKEQEVVSTFSNEPCELTDTYHLLFPAAATMVYSSICQSVVDEMIAS
ncbi:hypothetical protein GYMLUDRAFT_385220 [Collybiopsis luxurians FD-317 M1]|nr:hypothetical protein GYMLUDRAFT_385220 [Collybiopsis luxurians FD-317 M1]